MGELETPGRGARFRIMKRALREPLVHFLLLGSLLFIYYEWIGGAAGDGRIVVTSGQVQHFAAGFTRARQRPPTGQELKDLIDEHVKEEMATREAISRGLDRDDAVIRRRLRQKLEFLVEDGADGAPPGDAEIQAWADAHPESFRPEMRISLRQVFVSVDRRGRGASSEAQRLLAGLTKAGPAADATRLGDPTTLPLEMALSPTREVALVFGREFAEAVERIEPGRWAGPVASTYGLHLVLVRERVAPAALDLAAMRPRAEREIVTRRRQAELDAVYRRLLRKYSVVVESPALEPGARGDPGGSR